MPHVMGGVCETLPANNGINGTSAHIERDIFYL
jgi:hypothetical protein